MPEDQAPEPTTPTKPIPEVPKAFEWPTTTEPVLASELTATPETTLTPLTPTEIPAASPVYGALITDPTPAPLPKASSKKKLIVIGAVIIGSLGLLSGGTAAAYNVWYQNPDKVVLEAASSMLQQTTSTHKIAVDVKSKDSSIKFAIDAKLAELPATEVDVNAIYIYSGKEYAVKASVLTDKDGILYIKMNDLKKLVTAVADKGADVSAFDAVIKKYDGQWIKITSDDTKTLSAETSKSQVCATKALKSLNDKAVVKEINDVYMAHQFIVVGEKIGVKPVNGVDSLGYKVTIDEAKAKTFYTALGTTSVGKSLTACDKTFDFKQPYTTTDNSSPKPKSEIQVWSSRFGHEMKEIDVMTKSDDGTMTSTVWQPTFSKGVTVVAPTTSFPVSEVSKDLEQAYGSYYSAQYRPRRALSSSNPSSDSMQYTTLRSTSQKLIQTLTK